MKSPIKWYGGKHYLAEWIVSLMPPHSIYAEAFGGGASVLCRKEPAQVEAYNDICLNLVRFFRVLRNQRDSFIDYMHLVPFSQEEFQQAKNSISAGEEINCNELQLAARDFIVWRQSFAAQGKSWAYSTTRSRGGIADCVNAWRNAIGGLYEVSERLLNVQLHNESAFDFIPRFDWTGAVIYCDPPYVGESRAAKSVYEFEMTNAEHVKLCNLLNTIRLATVLVSGYNNAIYNDLLNHSTGWHRHVKEISNHAAGGESKRRMTECVWVKYGNGVK